MASTDARPVPQKNVAYRVTFPILDADGDLVTGATGLDSEVSKDGAAFADCTNEATEIATNSGMYFLDLTSTEMNADTVAIIVKTSSAGAKTTPIVLYPEEAGDIRVNVTQVNGTNQTAGDIIGDTNDIQTRLPAALVSGRMDSSVGAMAANTLTATAINADAITAAKIADGAITAAKAPNLDAAVSSRLASASYTAPPSAAANATAVWGEAVPGAFGAGTAGKVLGDNLNATVSSRSTFSPSDAVEGAVTWVQSARGWNAALMGKASGLATTEAKYRDLADSKDRITATVDADGNRTAVTRDLT